MSIESVQILQDPDIGLQGDASSALPVLEEGSVPVRQESLPADFPEGAALQGDGSVILTLKYAVTLKFRDGAGVVTTEPYKTLHLQRLKGKHRILLRNASPDDFRAQMISCSSGLSLGRAKLVHDGMDEADIAAVLKVTNFFMTPGRKTGL